MREVENIANDFDIYQITCNHFDIRTTDIKVIIVHCFGLSLQNMLQVLNEQRLSVHYIIPVLTSEELKIHIPELFRDFIPQYPTQVPVIQLVDDQNRAYHAGHSKFANFNALPGCEKGLNNCSIGIEFEIPQYTNGDGSDLYKFGVCTPAQINTGINFMQYLLKKHQIPQYNILAHSTIAVGRKTDPGPLFFWKEMSQNGIGYSPIPKQIEISNQPQYVKYMLNDIGFRSLKDNESNDNNDLNELIDAYIMQFAPELWRQQNNDISSELVYSLAGFECVFNVDVPIYAPYTSKVDL